MKQRKSLEFMGVPQVRPEDVAAQLRMKWAETPPSFRTGASWDNVVDLAIRHHGRDIVVDALTIIVDEQEEHREDLMRSAATSMEVRPEQMAAIVGNGRSVERDPIFGVRLRYPTPPSDLEAEKAMAAGYIRHMDGWVHHVDVLEIYRQALREIADRDYIHPPHDPGSYVSQPSRSGPCRKIALKALGVEDKT